jgi:pimeloyl-ACP methyl ester carboxylesterase
VKNLRKYGKKPFNIAVLHGGPGAPGEMSPVARELSSISGVLEPLQTADSIKEQVKELNIVLKEHADLPAILVGWSWGATVGSIFAAQFPSLVSKLILVSSPPFEDKYAADILKTRLSRLNEKDKAEVLSIMGYLNEPAMKDKNKLMARLGKLLSRADSYDPLPHDDDILECQYDIYQKVWKEASEMRSSGKLLDLGKKIKCPVIAIHGDYDPHPSEGVKEPLSNILKDFRFILLEKCGHKPWIERGAREKFYEVFRGEILPF